jgi:hypothetical protein
MSARRASRLLQDGERASHFVVQWIEGVDEGMYSHVPGKQLAANPPFVVDETVLVKFAAKNGAIEKERAKIVSKEI